jgi:hypothetical protein
MVVRNFGVAENRSPTTFENNMQIILTTLDAPLASAWEKACAGLDFVSAHTGSISEAKCDAVVSPANSFGFMDGGIDMAYSRYFGWHVQDCVQDAIKAFDVRRTF